MLSTLNRTYCLKSSASSDLVDNQQDPSGNQMKIVNAVRLGQRKNNNSAGRSLHVQVSNLNVKKILCLMQRNYII